MIVVHVAVAVAFAVVVAVVVLGKMSLCLGLAGGCSIWCRLDYSDFACLVHRTHTPSAPNFTFPIVLHARRRGRVCVD